MAVLVIVHGAFGGGWEWSDVAGRLRRTGHDVFTPTLTGLGDRSHLETATPIGLATWLDDLVALLDAEDLAHVVLCAASFGGMLAESLANRRPERVSALVYIDALVPRAGECALDVLPQWFAQDVRAGHPQHGDRWRVPVPGAVLPTGGRMPEHERVAYVDRLRPQPVLTFLDPAPDLEPDSRSRALPSAYVRCAETGFAGASSEFLAEAADRARRDGSIMRVLDAPHDPHLAEPALTADLLDELATQLDHRV